MNKLLINNTLLVLLLSWGSKVAGCGCFCPRPRVANVDAADVVPAEVLGHAQAPVQDQMSAMVAQAWATPTANPAHSRTSSAESSSSVARSNPDLQEQKRITFVTLGGNPVKVSVKREDSFRNLLLAAHRAIAERASRDRTGSAPGGVKLLHDEEFVTEATWSRLPEDAILSVVVLSRLTTGKRRQLEDTHTAGQFFYYFSDWSKNNSLSIGILGDDPNRIDRIGYSLDKIDDYMFVFQNMDQHYYISESNRYLRWSWSRMQHMAYDLEERVYIRDPEKMAIELLSQGYALAERGVRIVERGKISGV